jgi:hypothetical protein
VGKRLLFAGLGRDRRSRERRFVHGFHGTSAVG